MAVLRQQSTGQTYILSSCFLVGRSHACDLRITSQLVSGEHATIRWSGPTWELRDLNSSNGTFCNDHRLRPEETMELTAGAKIQFGAPENLFVFEDDAPPVLIARGNDGTTVQADEDSVLLLPGHDAPEYIFFEDEPGHWFVELPDGDCRRLEEGRTLQTKDGRVWRLDLPLAWERTWQKDKERLRLSGIGLRFRASRDEEHVDIEILRGSQVIPLETRAHSYLLLTLARARLHDREHTDLHEADHGWVDVEDLIRGKVVKSDMVNVLLHRARAQLRRANVMDADGIIERRRGPRRLRIGVAHLEIDP